MNYDLRGVSATKDEVHQAIKNLDKGLYPKAFCKILPDIVAGDEQYCNLMHADTAGTKTSLAYLYWKETGNNDIWKGVVQDAIVMNLDDMACVGCLDNIVLSSTIGRNKKLIPGDVIAAIINGASSFFDMLAGLGTNVVLAGGETADVGDIVRTIDIGYTAFARMKREDIIENHIKPGDVIVGLASFGQATYETAYNSGIGSNGLTSARHDVLDKSYATRFPESFSPEIPQEAVFCGSRKLTEEFEGHKVGDLLLSPTRTYLPVIRAILNEMRPNIHGIIHCTGGAQGKVKKFVENCHIVKDKWFDLPPVFRLIQQESGASLSEMFQVFNMGCRLEFYLEEQYAQEIIRIANSFGIEAMITGYVEAHEGEKVTIRYGGQEFSY